MPQVKLQKKKKPITLINRIDHYFLFDRSFTELNLFIQLFVTKLREERYFDYCRNTLLQRTLLILLASLTAFDLFLYFFSWRILIQPLFLNFLYCSLHNGSPFSLWSCSYALGISVRNLAQALAGSSIETGLPLSGIFQDEEYLKFPQHRAMFPWELL